jgi:hypothetical protein
MMNRLRTANLPRYTVKHNVNPVKQIQVSQDCLNIRERNQSLSRLLLTQ